MTLKQDNTELIDSYLQNEMSAEDKKRFEGLLSDPQQTLSDITNLQNEMELQQEIILAIRSRGLKEMLQRHERQKKIRRRLLYASSSTLTLLLAACVTLVLFLRPMAQIMHKESLFYAANLSSTSLVRDAQSPIQLVGNAEMFISKNQWSEANSIAKDVMKQTKNSSDEQLVQCYYDAEWLHLQCLMHFNRPIQAKRLLNKIADSESTHNKEARQILDKLK